MNLHLVIIEIWATLCFEFGLYRYIGCWFIEPRSGAQKQLQFQNDKTDFNKIAPGNNKNLDNIKC